MEDADCAVGSGPCLAAVDDLGFEIDEAEVIYWGRCPGCVAATPAVESGQQSQMHRERGDGAT